LFQPSHVFLGNMRLVHKAEDIVPVFYGPAYARWQPLAAFAHMNTMAPAGKPLVGSFVLTDPSIASHWGSFRPRLRTVTGPDGKGSPCVRPTLSSAVF
jgi:hypothetical protein